MRQPIFVRLAFPFRKCLAEQSRRRRRVEDPWFVHPMGEMSQGPEIDHNWARILCFLNLER